MLLLLLNLDLLDLGRDWGQLLLLNFLANDLLDHRLSWRAWAELGLAKLGRACLLLNLLRLLEAAALNAAAE